MVIKRYKYINAETGIKKVHSVNGVCSMNANIKKLQEKLSNNMNKAVSLANKNTIRNQNGHAVISKDDEWRHDDGWDK
jgi:hypothetical protein